MALKTLIIKNNGGSPVQIDDLGIIIAASSQETLTQLWDIRAALTSEDLRLLTNAGTLVLNDGTSDIAIAEVDNFIQYHDTGLDRFEVYERLGELYEEPTGFPNRTDSAISWSDINKRFTISPTSTSFEVFVKGICYTKTAESVQHGIDFTIAEGVWYFYYDNTGTLKASQSFWDLSETAPIAYIYWDNTNLKALLFGEERHGVVMPWIEHEYLHSTVGARYASGLSISYTLGDGSLDSHAQVAISNGLIYDEDLPNNVVDGSPQDISPIAYIPIYYLDGATPVWRKKTTITAYPVYEGTNRIRYNLNTAGTWSQPDAPSNGNYVAMFILATNDVNTPIIALLGQRYDTTLNAARDNNTYANLVFPNAPFQELKVLHRIIFQTSSVYGNTPKARIIEVQDLRAGGNLVSGIYTPPPTGVFGLYYTGAEIDGETVSLAPNPPVWVTVLTMTTGNIPAGKYRIGWSAECRVYSTNTYMYIRVRQDGATDHANYVISTAGDESYCSVAGYRDIALAAGSYSFAFEHQPEAKAETVGSRRVRLSFFKVE